MKKNLPFIALLLSLSITGFSQNIELAPTVIASAGDYSTSGNISLSWTLGEVAVTTLESGNLVLSQGFQQAFDKGTGFRPEPIEWNISAYPNPVNDQLNIRFDLQDPSGFYVEIQDVSGRKLRKEQYKELFSGDIVPLDMHHLKQGVYFVKVISADKQQVRILSIEKL